jgi:subtilisin family serine protease
MGTKGYEKWPKLDTTFEQGGIMSTRKRHQGQAASLFRLALFIMLIASFGEGTGAGLLKTREPIVSEGVELINARTWHVAGFTGRGVKVAILDRGFSGYRDLLGSELPRNVQTRSYRQDGSFEGKDNHGTAVAEIIHDVAPESDLYLVSFDTLGEAKNALQWLCGDRDPLCQDPNYPPVVDIIVMAWHWPDAYCFFDGGYLNKVLPLEELRHKGVLLVSAAGNLAQQHWSDIFRDEDGDSWHDEELVINLQANETIELLFSWEEPCNGAAFRYNVILEGPGIKIPGEGLPGQPWRKLSAQPSQGGTYYIKIQQIARDETQTRGIKLFSQVQEFPQEYRVIPGSIPEPGISPNVLTVGAVDYQTLNLESYSSQGPAPGGRIKPDLVAPTNVSVSPISGKRFSGTSAAAPHVAGAAALVKQACPGWGPDQIQRFLEDRAEDRGESGKDNQYGAGLLWLGPPLEDCAILPAEGGGSFE